MLTVWNRYTPEPFAGVGSPGLGGDCAQMAEAQRTNAVTGRFISSHFSVYWAVRAGHASGPWRRFSEKREIIAAAYQSYK